jgi:hypothetical protein
MAHWRPDGERTPRELRNARRIESILIRKPPLSFEEMLEEYQKVEAELVEEAGDDEFEIVETRRRIAEWILTAAFLRDQPFEVCERSWNHLVQLGFSNLDKKCTMTCIYADCCWENEQDKVGLAVVEPLITELEQFLAETMLPSNWHSHHESNLDALRRRRDELKAGIRE